MALTGSSLRAKKRLQYNYKVYLVELILVVILYLILFKIKTRSTLTTEAQLCKKFMIIHLKILRKTSRKLNVPLRVRV